jgi:hypothetical protein
MDLQVKKPAESKARWDYCKVVTEIPGDEAAKPLAQGVVAARGSASRSRQRDGS